MSNDVTAEPDGVIDDPLTWFLVKVAAEEFRRV